MRSMDWKWAARALIVFLVTSPVGIRAQTSVQYRAHPVARPPDDMRAIARPGRCSDDLHEQWLDIESRNDPSAMSGRSIVRNVCQASITPFLPDKKIATGAAMIVAPG